MDIVSLIRKPQFTTRPQAGFRLVAAYCYNDPSAHSTLLSAIQNLRSQGYELVGDTVSNPFMGSYEPPPNGGRSRRVYPKIQSFCELDRLVGQSP